MKTAIDLGYQRNVRAIKEELNLGILARKGNNILEGSKILDLFHILLS